MDPQDLRRTFFVYQAATRAVRSLVTRPLNLVEDAGKRERLEDRLPPEIRIVWRLLRRFF